MYVLSPIAYLTHLAAERYLAPATQRQAMSALLFLYRRVLGQELDGLEDHVRARGSPPAPVVLTVGEVRAVLGAMRGHNQLVATLLYGGGLRLIECLRLRVKDIDWDRRQLCVRQGKGRRDRFTTLPGSLRPAMTPTSSGSALSTGEASRPGAPAQHCQAHSGASSAPRPAHGPGNGSFLQPSLPGTGDRASCDGTTLTNPPRNAPSVARPLPRG